MTNRKAFENALFQFCKDNQKLCAADIEAYSTKLIWFISCEVGDREELERENMDLKKNSVNARLEEAEAALERSTNDG